MCRCVQSDDSDASAPPDVATPRGDIADDRRSTSRHVRMANRDQSCFMASVMHGYLRFSDGEWQLVR